MARNKDDIKETKQIRPSQQSQATQAVIAMVQQFGRAAHHFETFWNERWGSSRYAINDDNLNPDAVNTAPGVRFALSLIVQFHTIMIVFLFFEMQFILCWSFAAYFTQYLCSPCHRWGPSRCSQQRLRSHGKFFPEGSCSLQPYRSATGGGKELDGALRCYMTENMFHGCVLPSVLPQSRFPSEKLMDTRAQPFITFQHLRHSRLGSAKCSRLLFILRIQIL